MTNQDWETLKGKLGPAPATAPGFDDWMAKVNAILAKKTGVTADDLPDYCYHDEFEDGATPMQAAKAAIQYAQEG